MKSRPDLGLLPPKYFDLAIPMFCIESQQIGFLQRLMIPHIDYLYQMVEN